MTFISMIVGVLLVTSSATSSSPALAESPVVIPVEVPAIVRPLSVEDLIVKWADLYQVDTKLALDVARCESALNPIAIGDSGLAYGVFQFHKPTFDLFSKELGQDLDYYSTEDNVRLAMWGFSHGKQSHWSCVRLVVQ